MLDYALSDLRFTENPVLAGTIEFTGCEFIALCFDDRYSQCEFIDCTFTGCYFQDFEFAGFKNCVFKGGSFHKDPFSSAYISGCSFTSIDLSGVFYEGSLEDCGFFECAMRSAVFGELSQCQFEYCNLSHATIVTMSGCTMKTSDAPWISLKNISQCSFDSVDFGTTLKISGGYIEASEFSGCSLNQSKFTHTKFSVVDLNSCLMTKAIFEDCEAIQLAFSSCETTKARFTRVDFEGGSFSILDGMEQSQAKSMEFNSCQFTNDHMFHSQDMQKSLFFDCHDVEFHFTASNLSGLQFAACSGEVSHNECITMSPAIDAFSCDNLEFIQY